MAVISAHGLVKRFGSTTALDGLDLRVEAGEVHGFLGPNGAGKSTTIRILLGLLRPHAGTVRLLGGDPWDEAPELHRRRDALLERFDLDASRRARTYSRGNRQKVALVAALASDAELLLLDEPTSGLDPLMEVEFRAAVREDRTRGRTVLLSSHVLSEVEQICDRVTIIRAGRTVETGSLTELRHLNRNQVTAELAGPVPPDLATIPGVHDVVVDGARIAAWVESTALTTLLGRFAEVGVRSLTSHPPSGGGRAARGSG